MAFSLKGMCGWFCACGIVYVIRLFLFFLFFLFLLFYFLFFCFFMYFLVLGKLKIGSKNPLKT